MLVYFLDIKVHFEGLTLDIVTVDESNFSVYNQKFCVEGAQQNLVEVLSVISADLLLRINWDCLTITSMSSPFVSSFAGRSSGVHSLWRTGAWAFHSCSHDPRSYMILTTTLGLPSFKTRAERSRKACEMVLTELDGLLKSILPNT